MGCEGQRESRVALHRAMSRACPAELEGGGGGAGFCVPQPPPPPQPPSQPPPPPPLPPPLDHTLLKPPDGRLVVGAKPLPPPQTENGGGADAGDGAAALGDTPSVFFASRIEDGTALEGDEVVGASAEKGASVAGRENSHSPQHLRAKHGGIVTALALAGWMPRSPSVEIGAANPCHPLESEDSRLEPQVTAANSSPGQATGRQPVAHPRQDPEILLAP
eukprot:scaffold113540_cov69-Phaeocystis_antarctica.AAC.3